VYVSVNGSVVGVMEMEDEVRAVSGFKVPGVGLRVQG
jgi:hypothetical protein